MFPAFCQYWRIGQVIVMWSSFGFSYHLQISDLKGPSTPPRVFSQCPLEKQGDIGKKPKLERFCGQN